VDGGGGESGNQLEETFLGVVGKGVCLELGQVGVGLAGERSVGGWVISSTARRAMRRGLP